VKTKLRLIAVVTALIGARAFGAGSVVIPLIRLDEPMTAAPREPELPPVSFSIPKYTLPAADRETIAACLVFEAASQGDFGMRGVMAVIRNRAGGHPELFIPTIMRAKQFSALNKLTTGRETPAQTIARAKRDRMWPAALAIVEDALTDEWHDPTGGATHYTRSVESTPWTRHLAKTVTIGSHSFYR
jgi:spore germination cell wall hydrolase CwlJ-like protein